MTSKVNNSGWIANDDLYRDRVHHEEDIKWNLFQFLMYFPLICWVVSFKNKM
jgi:hypothetical protein